MPFRIACLMLCLILGLSSTAANASDPASARDAARELVEMTDMPKMLIEALDLLEPTLIGDIKKKNPGASEAAIRDVVSIVRKEFEGSANELVDAAIPIYERNFTVEELNDLLAFYRTKSGQSFLKKMPKVMAESQIIGQQWGERTMVKFIEKLVKAAKEKGLNI